MSTKYLGTEFDIHGGGMDLLFPHHESEIAQSTICNSHPPARYWIHNNMITVNGRKMGKSYNNQIRLTEMFSGSHPLLTKGYSPMTIRFFILQTHYRSTLDFGNDALQAAEKGLRRLWEAYELLKKFSFDEFPEAKNKELDAKVVALLGELDGFMNDDFNTAKVLANLFELVPVINSIHDKHQSPDVLSTGTVNLMKSYFTTYLENILGLTGDHYNDDGKLNGVMNLLIDLRKEARAKKDYATSDKIRNQLQQLGILLKDEKDGNVSYSIE
jgi:cysteinyl-tRNA synthetase